MTLIERFWAKVDKRTDEECWPWIAGKNSSGYGSFWNGSRSVCAHRFIYEATVGAVPEGLTLDHLCRNRACVNVAHMEPVTNRENVLRGEGLTARRAAQTHCVHGHPFDVTNTLKKNGIQRECRTCSILYHRRLRARKALSVRDAE